MQAQLSAHVCTLTYVYVHIHTQSVLPVTSLESSLLRGSGSQSLPLSLGEEYFYSGIQDAHWEKGARGGSSAW